MPPDDTEEIKNGQWMGVTVRSQGIGGKVSCINNSYLYNEYFHCLFAISKIFNLGCVV